MSNTTNPEDSKERKASLLSGFASIPPLDPPKEWSELTKEAWEEVGLRGALSGLSKNSPEFEQYSERLAEFLGVGVAELELQHERCGLHILSVRP
jgi:hypothetical protein